MKNEIRCPNCGTVFQIDESDYNSIVEQIRNEEFKVQLKEKENELKEKLNLQIQQAKTETEAAYKEQLNKKELDYQNLKVQLANLSSKSTEELSLQKQSSSKELSEKDSIIASLKKELELGEKAKVSAVAEAIAKEQNVSKEKDVRIAELQQSLKTMDAENQLSLKETLAHKENEIQALKEKIAALSSQNSLDIANEKQSSAAALAQKDNEIVSLKKEIELAEKEKMSAVNEALAKERESVKDKDVEIAQLKQSLQTKEVENRLAVKDALSVKDEEISKLNQQIAVANSEFTSKESALKNEFALQLKAKQEEVDFYKDFKARQSTKMIGESLESHCNTEFAKYRTLFPKAVFGKDNTVSSESGSKGDFIYRDYDDEGNEFISIMFEMKNEADTTATKKTNEHFFKELNKDRNEKKCEYAVLVSMLEPENELYNNGIVDVSYEYPKMYVIRPQFFMPIITLLRNAAMNSLEYKKQLVLIQNQNIDISNFEDNMNEFKDKFGRNYELASRKFKDAIDDIDRTIKSLEKTRADLVSSENNLRLANDKAQDLSIKKLTRNAPSVAEKFNELKK